MVTTDRSSEAVQASVHHLLQEVRRADGANPLDEAALLALDPASGGGDAEHLLHRQGEGGPLLGYASILADGTVQGMVHPDHRRQGIGTRLCDAVLERRPDAAVWAHGALPGSMAFLEHQRFAVRRTLLTLGLPLTGADLPSRSSSLTPLEVTTFSMDRDGEDWVALNAEAFANHPEQGRMTLTDLRDRARQPWFDPEGFLLARHHGELVGFVWTKVEEGEAEIYVVATSPTAQGHGVAGMLIGRALAHLQASGAHQAVLFVEGDNAPALALYRRLGFGTIDRHVQLSRVQEA